MSEEGLNRPILFKTMLRDKGRHAVNVALPGAMYVGAVWGDNLIRIGSNPGPDGRIRIWGGDSSLALYPGSSNVIEVMGSGGLQAELVPPDVQHTLERRVEELEHAFNKLINAPSKAEAYRRLDALREENLGE